ncbi:hypothetical protein B6N60_01943 [Richelia sinica FACHB-800]|uniref:Uncharacterized protein n=1 Tax=Richelia sinica FACHB-800 TaxID=1357546 RepID=A0A975T6X6_9NOST|nr:hypothetical protein B6N60_01943 [Richelia sinica FACHB-800]
MLLFFTGIRNNHGNIIKRSLIKIEIFLSYQLACSQN